MRLSLFDGRLTVPLPAAVLQTSHGSLLYTTQDLASEITGHYFAQVDVCDIANKPFSVHPLSKLTALPPHQINVLSCRSSNDSMTSTSPSLGLTMDCNSGRTYLDVTGYAKRIALDKPHIAIAMAHEVEMSSGSSRKTISLNKTLEWFQDLADYNSRNSTKEGHSIDWTATRLFGVIPGCCEHIKLDEYISKLVELGARGLVVGGLYRGEREEDRARVMRLVTGVLRERKEVETVPIMVQGTSSPEEILRAIYNGASLISTSYPRLMSKRNQAIMWNIRDYKSSTTEERELDEGIPSKRSRVESTDIFESAELDLEDSILARDGRPILEGCSCHGCRYHTRAYIHHLIKVKEILGEVLLYTHNQHQLLCLFEEVRSRLGRGSGRTEFARWAGIE